MPVEEHSRRRRRTAATSRRTAGSPQPRRGARGAQRGEGRRVYPIEARDSPFRDFGVNVRVLRPGQPNCLYHSEGAQRASSCCRAVTLIVEEEERHCGSGTTSIARPARVTSSSAAARPVRSPDDRGSARAGEAAVPGQRGRGEAWRRPSRGDGQPRRGLRRLARRLRAGAHPLAPGYKETSRSRRARLVPRPLVPGAAVVRGAVPSDARICVASSEREPEWQ